LVVGTGLNLGAMTISWKYILPKVAAGLHQGRADMIRFRTMSLNE
jgi:hypothetical protein